MTDPAEPTPPSWRRTAPWLAALVGALTWASWPMLRDMVGRWSGDPRYTHGFLVPAFALFVLWDRRRLAAAIRPTPRWEGVALLAVGAGVRLAGAFVYFEWIDALSLLPTLAGVAVLLGGWPALRWSWPAIAFLVFMIPLPHRLEVSLGQPLQAIATRASTYTLQTLGIPAVAEGNIILLDDYRLGVMEACNGLGMLFSSLAIATAVAVLVDRPATDRALVVLGAVPIALATNVARIVLTGVLQQTLGDRVAGAVYHDLAGWLMMPLALGLLWLELAALGRLFVAPRPAAPIPLPLS